MTALLQPIHERPPADVIMEKIGDLVGDGFKVYHNLVLVGLYVRPKEQQFKSSGIRFDLPDKTVAEDRHQSIVGMVLMKGPQAFRDDDVKKFDGVNPPIGTWVFLRASDGVKMMVKGQLCWRVPDIQIEGEAPHPDYVF
jgi:hypothetical protein